MRSKHFLAIPDSPTTPRLHPSLSLNYAYKPRTSLRAIFMIKSTGCSKIRAHDLDLNLNNSFLRILDEFYSSSSLSILERRPHPAPANLLDGAPLHMHASQPVLTPQFSASSSSHGYLALIPNPQSLHLPSEPPTTFSTVGLQALTTSWPCDFLRS